MEAQDGLDELFRSRLEEGHAPVPSFSWDAIQEKVALEKGKKSKKIAFPFLWMAASFVTGLIASGLFFYQYQLETENHFLKELALHYRNEQQVPLERITGERTNVGSSLQKEYAASIREGKSTKEVNVASPNKANLYSAPSVSNSALTAQNLPLGSKLKKTVSSSAVHMKEQRTSHDGEQKSNASALSSSKETSTVKSLFVSNTAIVPFLNAKQGKRNESVTSLAIKEKGNKQTFDLGSVTTPSTKNREVYNHKSSVSTVNSGKEASVIWSITQVENTALMPLATTTENSDKVRDLSFNKDSLLALVLDSLPEKEVEIKKTAKEKEKPKKEPRLFGLPITLGVYVAPEWASRSLKFSGNEDPELVTYKKNDQHKFGYSAGISLDLKLPERFYLRTGLNYWNVGDQNHTVLKAQPTKANSSIKSNPQSTNYFGPTPPKDTISFLPSLSNDMSLNSLSKEFSSSTKNNYHYLGIPALLGMKLGRSKLSAGIFSGILVNVLLSPSRSVYYVYYDPKNPDQYTESYRELSRFSLTYWGGIDIDYKLSKNWTINLSPNIKYSLTALYKDRETVRQLPYSFGVQVGCKYSF